MDVKVQYSLPIYNFENLESIPDYELQFVINAKLFIETFLMEIRGKSISYSSDNKKNKNENCRTGVNSENSGSRR